MIDIALLKILSDGKFHSGTELGSQLGLGRSAVWKQMKELKEFGVDVYSVRGRGYRLPKGLDLLDLSVLKSHFNTEAKQGLKHVELTTFTDSTNLMALRNIKNHKNGALYTAEYQSAGRGRRGRSWVGPLATNLYFSLIWRFLGGAASLEGLSLVVGLSVVQSLQDIGITGIEVKWPNDLLYQGKKLAGILLEMQGDASGEVSVVIGVGINVLMEKNSEANQVIDQPWVDLSSISNSKFNRNELLGTIISRLISNLHTFEALGFEPFIEPWHKIHAFQDSYIKLLMSNKEIEGVCRGVNERGGLLLERFEKIETYYGGEVSVRPSV